MNFERSGDTALTPKHKYNNEAGRSELASKDLNSLMMCRSILKHILSAERYMPDEKLSLASPVPFKAKTGIHVQPCRKRRMSCGAKSPEDGARRRFPRRFYYAGHSVKALTSKGAKCKSIIWSNTEDCHDRSELTVSFKPIEPQGVKDHSQEQKTGEASLHSKTFKVLKRKVPRVLRLIPNSSRFGQQVIPQLKPTKACELTTPMSFHTPDKTNATIGGPPEMTRGIKRQSRNLA